MTDFISIPDRLNELWPWFNAVCSWDWGDPAPLSDLIRAESIPDEFTDAVADIVAKTRIRKPNWWKSKLPAAERLEIAGAVSTVVDFCRILKTETAEGLESIAARLGKEPIELVQDLEHTVRYTKKNAAEQLNVSVETVDNLLRDMRSRIDRWPVV